MSPGIGAPSSRLARCHSASMRTWRRMTPMLLACGKGCQSASSGVTSLKAAAKRAQTASFISTTNDDTSSTLASLLARGRLFEVIDHEDVLGSLRRLQLQPRLCRQGLEDRLVGVRWAEARTKRPRWSDLDGLELEVVDSRQARFVADRAVHAVREKSR